MTRKKLIEVALPLEAINKASAKEKSIRHGHPSTLHLWWARRPLSACRAVLFASLVDDPSCREDLHPDAVEGERERLFRIIERLVQWENTNNPAVLAEAREEIRKSTGGNPPAIYDPFCGGGSIPLEAQRLGLDAYGSDLNPVAVLITKALIEIPPQFADQAPTNPTAAAKRLKASAYPGSLGLADDVLYYGAWMRARAEERIGHLYPKVKLPNGEEAMVIAWIWARTVRCPNPACGADMPLVRSFQLSSKPGKEAWVQPEVDHVSKTVKFQIRTVEGAGHPPTRTRNSAKCLVCTEAIKDPQLRKQAREHGLGTQLLGIVAEGERNRAYLSPDQPPPVTVRPEAPWANQPMPDNPRWFSPPAYGMRTFGDLFTNRQLVAMTTFSDLVGGAREQAIEDGASEGRANAIATYLALGVDRLADRCSSIASWDSGYTKIRNTFGRQAIPMTWDFAEGNPFSHSTGNFESAIAWIGKAIAATPGHGKALATQGDATLGGKQAVFSTDPPYYDNIGYADLSDFFYVWLRRSLRFIYPDLFDTLLVPKAQEMVATPYRFKGGSAEAKATFERRFGQAMSRIHAGQDPRYPMTVFYAFKQSETEIDGEDEDTPGVASTGWETMLEGLLRADFQVTGTWPMRSELSNRPIASGTNALASSIVLVCRPRAESAKIITRRDFLSALKRELAPAIRTLQQGNIAPVDLQQAAIGPGMAIFSRSAKVLEASGEVIPGSRSEI